jgi:hypothetical protein
MSTKKRLLLTVILGCGASWCQADPLAITNGPQSRVELAGEHTAFSVSINEPASFTWNFNGAPVLDATNSWLDITNIQASSAGTYTLFSRAIPMAP